MVDKPYNGGTWSSSKYFGFIRSALRRASVRWAPKSECLKAARKPYKGTNRRRKWQYQCASCKEWHKGSDVRVHHLVECGTLKAYSDLPAFVERLFCERAGFEVLCTACHGEKHGSKK
jgi:hypothetical protein